MKIAYLMSRFPKITETFIVDEIVTLRQTGIEVEVFPLQKEKVSVIHSQAETMLNEVHFNPWLSLSMVYINVMFLLKHPRKYLTTLFAVLRHNVGCANFFIGALAFFPKAVKIAQQCQTLKVTHIHAHFANHPTMVAFVVSHLTGIGYSFTAHGSDLHKRQQMLAEKFAHARFAVMISKYNRQFFSQSTGIDGGDKLTVIHCGVDTLVFQPNDSVEVKQHKPLNLLCVAALREVKGHYYLLDACNLLKQRGIGFCLHLVGDGPKRAAIEAQIKRCGLDKDVVLHGALRQSQMVTWLHQADICVLTSFQTQSGNREGIPMVLMEAMACGKAVVASRVSGIPELVEDGISGLLTNPQDSVNIAEQLQKLIADGRLRQRLGQAGRVKVLREFNLQANIEQLITLFRQYDD